ncbi:unnamed protein product [Pleuronectes platessa]|uniref:Uncharacterized protein n=1 Tax=Pleuronectes platessa TaxID=8262 RepID=A0A9N7UYT1_PLEPL|nr:unnamed protein product [Pleuronectes platessa]
MGGSAVCPETGLKQLKSGGQTQRGDTEEKNQAAETLLGLFTPTEKRFKADSCGSDLDGRQRHRSHRKLLVQESPGFHVGSVVHSCVLGVFGVIGLLSNCKPVAGSHPAHPVLFSPSSVFPALESPALVRGVGFN